MLRNIVNGAIVVLSVALLAATGAWLWFEEQWNDWSPPPGNAAQQRANAFNEGRIGLEILPLKYVAVLDQISGPAFTTGTEDGRSVWESYGFLPNPAADGTGGPLCADNADRLLPYGFNISNTLPRLARQTPVQFVGLSCATCHSTRLRTADGIVNEIIPGAGNQALDVITFSEAVRNALLDPSLEAGAILDAYYAQCPDDETGFLDRQLEALIIGFWVSAGRSSIGDGTGAYGLPYHGSAMKQADNMPAGPGRTRPFRSIVRAALAMPGEENYAYSKLPAVFEQDGEQRPASQFDGSIHDTVTRSFTAAYASGSSLLSLGSPEGEFNIRHAAAHTEELGSAVPVKRFADLFPAHRPSQDAIDRGFAAYMQYCAACHGYRPLAGDRGWVAEGAHIHEVMPLERIGTDPERVTFRYADMLALGLTTTLPASGDGLDRQRERLVAVIDQATQDGAPVRAWFWQQHLDRLNGNARQFRTGHPLAFDETDLTDTPGYVNNPIPYTYLRAPYLHNGSVPTMRQFINLDPRPDRFCRGDNVYDPDAMGFVAPAPDADGNCPVRESFLFDTSARGNSNAGHDFPWSYRGPGWDEQTLLDLLAYLKTL